MASDGSSSLDNSLEFYEKKPFIVSIDNIAINTIIEAKDKYENWFISKVVAVDDDLKRVKVHFAGWGSRFDEWVDLDKQRLREAGPNATERYHRKKEKPLKVGDRVQAKWEDNRSYLGYITSIRDDQADIVFDDGVQVTRPLSSVRRRLQDKVLDKSIQETVKKEANMQALAEARRRRARKRRNDDDSITTDDYSSPPSSPVVERRKRKAIPLALLSDDESDHTMSKSGPEETNQSLDSEKEGAVPMDTSRPMESMMPIKEEQEEGEEPIPTPHTLTNTPSMKDVMSTSSTEQNTIAMETDQVPSNDATKAFIKPEQQSQPTKPSVKRRRASKLLKSEDEEGARTRKQSDRLKLKKENIKSDKVKPVHVAPKEHVIVLDHNKFKCYFANCKKSFRKDILLNAHLKHYHDIQVEEKEKQPTNPNPKPKGLSGRLGKSSNTKKSSDSNISTVKKDTSSKTSHEKGGGASTTSKISPKQKTNNPAANVAASVSFSSKPHSHSTPLKQQSHASTSTPRKGSKNKIQTKDNNTKSVDLQLVGISPLSKFNVPPEEKADQLYKHMKTKAADTTPSDIVKVENSEMYRDRGKLRPLRKSSHGSNLDFIETESEETMGETTEDEEGEESEGVVRHGIQKPSSDVVHCACGDNADEGFMIQCDQCLTWQHGDCVCIDEGDAPDQYLCKTCCSPPGRRNRIVHKFHREWFTKGRLPTLPGGPELSITQREAVLHTHKLADVLCKLKKMVHCTKIKLDAVKTPNHNYMKHWVKQCSHITITEIHNYLMKVLSPVMNDIPMPSLDGEGVVNNIAMETNTGSELLYETPLIDAMFEVESDKVVMKDEQNTIGYQITYRLTTPSECQETLLLKKDDSLACPLTTPLHDSTSNLVKELGITYTESNGNCNSEHQLNGHHTTDMDTATTGTDTATTGTDTATIGTATATTATGTATTGTATTDTATGTILSTVPTNTTGTTVAPYTSTASIVMSETGTDTATSTPTYTSTGTYTNTETIAIDSTASLSTSTTTTSIADPATGTNSAGMATTKAMSISIVTPNTDIPTDTTTGTSHFTTSSTGTAPTALSSGPATVKTTGTSFATTGTVLIASPSTGTTTGTTTGSMIAPSTGSLPPRIALVSNIVREICDKILQGDVSTQWFHKLLLLDHISHVQEKMTTCLDEVDQQMEGLSPVALEDCREILTEVQKTSIDLHQLRRSLVNAPV